MPTAADYNIIDVWTNDNVTYFKTADKRLYSAGMVGTASMKNAEGCRLGRMTYEGSAEDVNTGEVTGFDSEVVDVSIGAAHVLALTSSGSLYGIGSNEFGQLGLSVQRTLAPTLITRFSNIKSFVASHDLSCVLTNDNKLTIMGDEWSGVTGSPADPVIATYDDVAHVFVPRQVSGYTSYLLIGLDGTVTAPKVFWDFSGLPFTENGAPIKKMIFDGDGAAVLYENGIIRVYRAYGPGLTDDWCTWPIINGPGGSLPSNTPLEGWDGEGEQPSSLIPTKQADGSPFPMAKDVVASETAAYSMGGSLWLLTDSGDVIPFSTLAEHGTAVGAYDGNYMANGKLNIEPVEKIALGLGRTNDMFLTKTNKLLAYGENHYGCIGVPGRTSEIWGLEYFPTLQVYASEARPYFEYPTEYETLDAFMSTVTGRPQPNVVVRFHTDRFAQLQKPILTINGDQAFSDRMHKFILDRLYRDKVRLSVNRTIIEELALEIATDLATCGVVWTWDGVETYTEFDADLQTDVTKNRPKTFFKVIYASDKIAP